MKQPSKRLRIQSSHAAILVAVALVVLSSNYFTQPYVSLTTKSPSIFTPAASSGAAPDTLIRAREDARLAALLFKAVGPMGNRSQSFDPAASSSSLSALEVTPALSQGRDRTSEAIKMIFEQGSAAQAVIRQSLEAPNIQASAFTKSSELAVSSESNKPSELLGPEEVDLRGLGQRWPYFIHFHKGEIPFLKHARALCAFQTCSYHA